MKYDQTLHRSKEDLQLDHKHPMKVTNEHYVLSTPIQPPFEKHLKRAVFGMGCFWGVEKTFWQMKGVYSTAVGYAGGVTLNPQYEEVCTGLTLHNEVVLVVFDPSVISYVKLLKAFFENHNPTQGMRQGNDKGTQYRSGIYYNSDEQRQHAHIVKDRYQATIKEWGYGEITTEVLPAAKFFYAEDYHQQYLAKNPDGYCGLGGLGVTCG